MKNHFSRTRNLETSLVIATGLLVVWYFRRWEPLIWGAMGVGLIGLFFDGLAGWITRAWYGLAELLGKVVPKVLLGAVFFLFLTPMAWMQRLVGKRDPLRLRQPEGSNWTVREHVFRKEDLEKMW